MKEKKQFNSYANATSIHNRLRYRLFFSGISVLGLKNEETQKQSLTGLTTRTLDHYRLLVIFSFLVQCGRLADGRSLNIQ